MPILSMHEADGRDHVEIGAGQRAVGQPQAAVLAVDGAAIERERCHIGADRRHRVAHQEDFCRAALGAQRNGDGRRVDMDAVGDQAGRQRCGVDRRARHSRFAVADLAHRVEQMRDHSRAGLSRSRGEAVARIGMAEADDDASPGERFDPPRLDGLRCNGRQQHRQSLPRRDQRVLVGIVHRPDQRRIMRALPAHRQMRPFQMQAEETRHLKSRRLDAGLHRRLGLRLACR